MPTFDDMFDQVAVQEKPPQSFDEMFDTAPVKQTGLSAGEVASDMGTIAEHQQKQFAEAQPHGVLAGLEQVGRHVGAVIPRVGAGVTDWVADMMMGKAHPAAETATSISEGILRETGLRESEEGVDWWTRTGPSVGDIGGMIGGYAAIAPLGVPAIVTTALIHGTGATHANLVAQGVDPDTAKYVSPIGGLIQAAIFGAAPARLALAPVERAALAKLFEKRITDPVVAGAFKVIATTYGTKAVTRAVGGLIDGSAFQLGQEGTNAIAGLETQPGMADRVLATGLEWAVLNAGIGAVTDIPGLAARIKELRGAKNVRGDQGRPGEAGAVPQEGEADRGRNIQQEAGKAPVDAEARKQAQSKIDALNARLQAEPDEVKARALLKQIVQLERGEAPVEQKAEMPSVEPSKAGVEAQAETPATITPKIETENLVEPSYELKLKHAPTWLRGELREKWARGEINDKEATRQVLLPYLREKGIRPGEVGPESTGVAWEEATDQLKGAVRGAQKEEGTGVYTHEGAIDHAIEVGVADLADSKMFAGFEVEKGKTEPVVTAEQARKQPALAEYAKKRGMITDEEYAQIKADVLKGAKGETVSSLGVGQLENMVKLGVYYIERGARTFVSWARAMVKDIGEWIRPKLREIWARAQEFHASEQGALKLPWEKGQVGAPLAGGTKAENWAPGTTVEQKMDAWVSGTGKTTRPLGNKVRGARDWLVRNWLRDTQGGKDFNDAANAIRIVLPGEDVFKHMTVFRNAAAANARDAMDRGVFSLVTGQRMGPAAREIFAPLGKITGEKMRRWGQYAAAREARERIAENPEYNPGASSRDIESYYRKYKNAPGFEQAAKTYTQFQKSLVAMVAETGRISQDQAANIISSFPEYAPLMRIMQSGAGQPGGKGGVPIGHLTKTGGGQQVVDPLVSMQLMAQQFYRAAAQANIARIIADTADPRGMEDWAKPIPAPTDAQFIADLQQKLRQAGAKLTPMEEEVAAAIMRATGFYTNKDNRIVVFRQGKPQWYELDPELYRAVTQEPLWKIPATLDAIISKPAQLKRVGATGLQPGFGFYMNVLRDVATHGFRTEGNFFTSPLRVLGALGHQLASASSRIRGGEGDVIARLYEQYGGEASQFIGQDMSKAYRNTREMINDAAGQSYKNLVTDKWAPIVKPAHYLQAIFSVLEKTPRLAEFEMMLKKYGYTREMLEAGTVPPPGLVVEAMYAAMNVTTNFGQAGRVGRIENKLNAFWNAAIQDVLTDYEVIKAHPARSLFRGTMMLTLPSLAYWWCAKDEDWYKELPGYRKYTGWNFRLGNSTLYVPSPFLAGAIFGQLPVALMDSLYHKNPDAVKQVMGQVWQNYGVQWQDVIPDAIEPLIETTWGGQGWSLFRHRPIISDVLATREPRDQYYDYTTGASRYFGYMMNVPPAKLDHLISGYTGGLGTNVLSLQGEGAGRTLGWARAIRTRESVQAVDQFYTQATDVEQRYNSALDAAKARGATSIADIQLATEHYRFSRLGAVMSDIRAVYKGTADVGQQNEKTRYLVGLSRVAMGKESLGMYPSIFQESALRPELVDIRDKFLASLARAADAPFPELVGGIKGRARRREVTARRNEARDLLAMLGITVPQARRTRARLDARK